MRISIIVAAVVMITGCAADPNIDNWKAIMAAPNYRPAPVVMPPVIIYQQPVYRDSYPAFNNLYSVPQHNHSNPVNYICPDMRCF